MLPTPALVAHLHVVPVPAAATASALPRASSQLHRLHPLRSPARRHLAVTAAVSADHGPGMSSSAASVAAAAARSGVAYSLGRVLYLSLTNRTNARSIVDTRGPSFAMPASSGFRPLLPGLEHEPLPEELAAVVDACYENMDIVGMGENDPGVVFGGAGEPLLRLETITATMEAVRASRHGVPFRISTNGLFPASVAAALAAARVGRVTVALATADPRQYEALMQPEAGSGGHAAVCGFVVNLVEAGVEVECTVVKAPGVDVTAARQLAEALGAVEFRAREFFE
uniref:Radical SAM core domain-containing protein n=1 Tax=Mantoniella antarctica TaxID=81844 RepID=A0A7S0SPP3_9CHLO|mmetsp:Transcript_31783/g.79871  ORF Transcript_31783/g.79871 Transcript_31783/m.79871 type:complete len:284 (+) Transcript_31783:121-972(+)